MTDCSKVKLFRVIIENVLLYNVETWAMAALLVRLLNLAHSVLLRMAFRNVGHVALKIFRRSAHPFAKRVTF